MSKMKNPFLHTGFRFFFDILSQIGCSAFHSPGQTMKLPRHSSNAEEMQLRHVSHLMLTI